MTKVEQAESFCYNQKIDKGVAGGDMSGKINVLGIYIDNYTAKEAMKRAMEYMESDPVNIIDLVTVNDVMDMEEAPGLKEEISEFDLVLAGDRTILEAADIDERKYLQETERSLFLKMFLRYLHKNHKRVYLLVETEEEGQILYDYLERYYGGIQISGMAKVSAGNRADDMLVNAINGAEIDCVISVLSSPLQEDFAVRNRNLLNTRILLGLGKELLPVFDRGAGTEKMTRFLLKRIFKKEMKKRKKEK